MNLLKLILIRLKKTISFIVNFFFGMISEALIWLGLFFLFGCFGAIITGKITIHDAIYEYPVLFISSFLIFIIGLTLETWLFRGVGKSRISRRIRRLLRKLFGQSSNEQE